MVKTVESMSIDVMRLLALAAHRDDIRRVNISVSPAVATYLNNRKRRDIARIESEANMTIHLRGEMSAGDVAARFSHAWPTTTRHLRVLEHAGLVRFERRGRKRVYRVEHGRLGLFTEWLSWFDRPAVASATVRRASAR